MLDNSAKTSWHTHPWDFVSFTHDYHDLAQDDYTVDPTEPYGSKNEDGTINLRESRISALLVVPALAEPIEAGIIVALINKYVIRNHHLWDRLCWNKGEEAKQEQEDASSTATSITDAEIRMRHTY